MAEIREPQKVTSIEKKRKIIDAGLKAFGEKGYFNTTTVEIAKLAGVSTGIVYSYFKDKKDILLQALELYFHIIFQPMEALLKSVRPPLDLEKIIRAIIHVSVKSHTDNLIAHEEMIAMSHLDNDVHRLFMRMEQKISDTIVGYLKKNGIRSPHIEEKTHIAYNLVETLSHEYVYHRHEYLDYDEMIDQIVQLVVSLFAN